MFLHLSLISVFVYGFDGDLALFNQHPHLPARNNLIDFAGSEALLGIFGPVGDLALDVDDLPLKALGLIAEFGEFVGDAVYTRQVVLSLISTRRGAGNVLRGRLFWADRLVVRCRRRDECRLVSGAGPRPDSITLPGDLNRRVRGSRGLPTQSRGSCNCNRCHEYVLSCRRSFRRTVEMEFGKFLGTGPSPFPRGK